MEAYWEEQLKPIQEQSSRLLTKKSEQWTPSNKYNTNRNPQMLQYKYHGWYYKYLNGS